MTANENQTQCEIASDWRGRIGVNPSPEVPKTISVPYTKKVRTTRVPAQQPIKKQLPGTVPRRSGVGGKLGQQIGTMLFGSNPLVGGVAGKVGQAIGNIAENLLTGNGTKSDPSGMLNNGSFDPSQGQQLGNAYAVYGTAQERGGGSPVWATANDGETRVSGNPNTGATTVHNKYGVATTTHQLAGGGTASSTSKIVCTAMNEAYGFGGFRNAIWLKYAKDNLTPYHEKGYHAIFRPLIKLGYDRGISPIRKVLEHIARHRSVDLRAEMRGGKRAILGRAYRAILEPICYAVGRFI
jgi:hypothetical protein